MAAIRPFRGWRYTAAAAGTLGDVIAPPYDVISPAEQASLGERNAHNVVMLELTPALSADPPGDAGERARHARARRLLDAWSAAGVLVPEQRPAFYLYRQEYTLHGRPLHVDSCIAAVGLVPWSSGEVLPHERTLAAPKAERLALLRATEANISPIWSLYEDPEGAIARTILPFMDMPPVLDLRDDAGTRHVLRVVDTPDAVEAIGAAFSARTLFIADGHHRYETALAYLQERLAAAQPVGEAAAVMMVLTSTSEPGLQVLPTHRMIRGVAPSVVERLTAQLARHFEIAETTVPAHDADLHALLDRSLGDSGAGARRSRFALIGPEPQRLRVLTLAGAAQGERSALDALDVWQAHRVLLGEVLGLSDASISRQENLTYTRDAIEAAQAVRTGEAQLALLLAPTPVEQMLAVSREGAVMPEKSTYFVPKPATGLVLRRLSSTLSK